ncbi:activating signal cointegrator 1 complex subunit [Cystoisospora suis]|uniref:Activating signal cointegrator 1 complex subunit n=1 Tax=Cystoisospora suis TaxID=483139 RepID=A0A2C6KQF1_9APIC|nr:activating signal cointegrator 1 complex subunit [Cystoisospora suis]
MAFYFGSGWRPIPLEQTFVGVFEKDLSKQKKLLNEICYDKVVEAVRKGYQVMVFVHARGETLATAEFLIRQAQAKKQLSLFTEKSSECPSYRSFLSQVAKSRNPEVESLFRSGFAIHHAGLLRHDRLLAEKMFRAGGVRVLCCTSTLAWGVNLPARVVIIKGTSIYDTKAGGFKDLGILDVLQIFGRAGRPQYDSRGSAILLTCGSARLSRFLRLLTNHMPVDSKFLDHLPNALNAEIAIGTVTSVSEAVDWLGYTFLFVRMYRYYIEKAKTFQE